jgi:SAM-dependent methyltransferase
MTILVQSMETPEILREKAINNQKQSAGASDRSDAASRLKLVPSLCCICQIDDADPVGVGEDFEYRTCPDTFLAVQCRRCQTVYLNPRPADGEANRIYPNDYHAFEFDEQNYGFIYRVRRRIEARRLLRWCRGLPTNARILDVGCGDGFHLKLLRDFGEPTWRLEGIDQDPRAVAAAARSGLTVRQGAVEDVDLPAASFELAILIMTIEHLANPLQTLQAIKRLLAPGGRLCVITDNAGSPDFKIFRGRHWGGYHFPRHFNLFTRASLGRLGVAAGYAVERVATDYSPVNWVYSIRNWLDDTGAPRRLVNGFSLQSTVALAAFTALDVPLAAIGQGAILRATFRNLSSGEAAA